MNCKQRAGQCARNIRDASASSLFESLRWGKVQSNEDDQMSSDVVYRSASFSDLERDLDNFKALNYGEDFINYTKMRWINLQVHDFSLNFLVSICDKCFYEDTEGRSKEKNVDFAIDFSVGSELPNLGDDLLEFGFTREGINDLCRLYFDLKTVKCRPENRLKTQEYAKCHRREYIQGQYDNQSQEGRHDLGNRLFLCFRDSRAFFELAQIQRSLSEYARKLDAMSFRDFVEQSEQFEFTRQNPRPTFADVILVA